MRWTKVFTIFIPHQPITPVRRVTFHLTEKQIEWFKERAETEDTNYSELIRRALDHWIDIKSDPVEQAFEKALGPAEGGTYLREKPYSVDIRDRLERTEYMVTLLARQLLPSGFGQVSKLDAKLGFKYPTPDDASDDAPEGS